MIFSPFDGANSAQNSSFAVANITSIVPDRSMGDATPTFTRATTAYQTDFEGKLNAVLSGEARFQGARRVENLIPAAGTGSASLANGANKTATVAVGTYVFSIGAEATGTNLITFTGTATGSSGTLTANATKRASTVLTITGAGTIIATATTLASVDLQLENVSGQANQNPSEYVSIGVLSTPWHGAGVDGVKYFSTLNGNTVASNVVTEATGTAITSAAAEAASGVTAGVVDADVPLSGLSEAARTNLGLQSQTLGTASWNQFAMAVTDNAIAAPDGTTTAEALVPSAATTAHYIYQTGSQITRTASAPIAYSIYAKKGDYTFFTVQVDDNVGGVLLQSWNLTTGAVGANSVGNWTSVVASIQAVGNGWYRCMFTAVGPVGTLVNVALSTGDNAATLTNTGDGAKKTYAWGHQFEDNVSSVSSYIPTTTVAVTRNASVDQYVSAGNVTTNNFTLYGESAFNPVPPAGSYFLWGSYVDADNSTSVLWDGTNLIARKRIAGVTTDATKALTPTAGTVFKWAARFSSVTGIDIFHTGAIGTNDATTTACQIGTNFQIGADGNGANQPFGTIRDVKIWQRSLSNAQLTSQTS